VTLAPHADGDRPDHVEMEDQVPCDAEIDLSSGLFWSRSLTEREAAFEVLRGRPGLAFFPEPDPGADWMPRGPGYYAVTRHAEVIEASRRPDVFRSGPGATIIGDLPVEFLEFFGSMINMDDPRHARLRSIVSRAFTPRMIVQIEARIAATCAEIANRVRELGAFDFVSEVSARLPLRVIFDMIGIGAEHVDAVERLATLIISEGDPDLVPEGEDVAAAVLAAGAELAALVESIAAHRLRHPADDLTTALVTANVDGEHLTGQELASFFILLVVAGSETTRHAISHSLVALTDNPGQRAAWRSDPAALTRTAVEEIVRWSSPVIWMRRTVASAATLGGQHLDAGAKVVLFYNSANRDAAVFNLPHAFDINRQPNPHLGFGAPGPHYCLGAHLARREIALIWQALLERTPSIAATRPPERLTSSFINGIKRLPCEVSPC
jgi:cytochrome P450